MQNLKPVKNPHEHFATFWKQQSSDAQQQFAELEADLVRATDHVNSVGALSQCATIEVFSSSLHSPTATTGAPNSSDETPTVYWVVTGDVVEVALIACEMMKQQRENERQDEQSLKARISQFDANNERRD